MAEFVRDEEAVELLKSYKKALRQIKQAKLEKELALERATFCGVQNSNFSNRTGISDKVGKGAVESEYWDSVVSKLEEEAKNITSEIMRYASQLNEIDETIITEFYLKNYSPKKIAKENNYSTRQIYRKLSTAEKNFIEIYKSCHRMSRAVTSCHIDDQGQ